jgi:hypothetical protein
LFWFEQHNREGRKVNISTAYLKIEYPDETEHRKLPSTVGDEREREREQLLSAKK